MGGIPQEALFECSSLTRDRKSVLTPEISRNGPYNIAHGCNDHYSIATRAKHTVIHQANTGSSAHWLAKSTRRGDKHPSHLNMSQSSFFGKLPVNKGLKEEAPKVSKVTASSM